LTGNPAGCAISNAPALTPDAGPQVQETISSGDHACSVHPTQAKGGGTSDFNLDHHAFATKIGSALRAELKAQNAREIGRGLDGCE
jgi:hypothetical protein